MNSLPNLTLAIRTLLTPLIAIAASSGILLISAFPTTCVLQHRFGICLAGTSKNHPFENSSNNSSSLPTTSSNNPLQLFARSGWNHNLPGPNSSFWAINNDTRLSPPPPPPPPPSPPPTLKPPISNQPKTGWLHYKTKDTTEPNYNTPLKSSETKEKTETNNNQKPPLTNQRKTGWLHHKHYNSVETNHNTTLVTSQPKMKLESDDNTMQTIFNHRLLAAPVLHPCGGTEVAVVTEHCVSVPLRYDQETPDYIDIFFTLVEPLKPQDEAIFTHLRQQFNTNSLQQSAHLYKQHFHSSTSANPLDESKCLLYLQGGPGFGAPTPITAIGLSEKSSWLGEILFGKGATLFNRVLLMDQRGTGRSSPITKQSLAVRYPELFLLDSLTPPQPDPVRDNTNQDDLTRWEEMYPESTKKFISSVDEATDFMSQFRADNIVRDAETLKEILFQDKKKVLIPYGGVLGQSYGGFCIFTYLSIIKEPPKMCFITGGIPPIFTPIQQVYSSLWKKVQKRNELFYKRYPQDIAIVKRIVRRLMDRPEPLPSGGILTARRFLQLGLSLGGSPSSFASLHNLVSTAFVSENDTIFSRTFLKSIDSTQPFDDHPIYCLLHESIYADGEGDSNPTGWTAHRVFENLTEMCPEFNYLITSKEDHAAKTMFFGEVVFPWMCEGDFAELSGVGMRNLANNLSQKRDWGQLYDTARIKQVLSIEFGISKAAAAVYFDDMYVDFDSSLKVVDYLDDKIKVWITNDYQHSGLRDDGSFIISKLLGILNGSVGTPS